MFGRNVHIFSLFLIPACIFGGKSYQPTEQNLQARKWFQDSKFGLFIHWGPYSVLEKGEWVLHQSKMSLEDYFVSRLGRRQNGSEPVVDDGSSAEATQTGADRR